jgi:hypothetical protein
MEAEADSVPPREMLASDQAAVGAAASSALPPRYADELISHALRWAIDAYD